MGRSRYATRSGQAGRDWTQGSISGNLISLGWPMMVGGTLNMLGPTIDMIWVGKLGPAAIAAVGMSGMVVMLANSMLMGVFQGLRAMVARFIGAGETAEANRVAQQAVAVAIVYSVVMALIGILLAEHILRLLGVGPDVIKEGAPYLRINFIGMVTMSFRMLSESAMQASGDSRAPMWVAILFRLFHIALAPFLIFGWWVFPSMGVTGAALTNVLSQGLGAAIGLWFLFSGRTRLRLTLRGFRFRPDLVWRLAKLALPASVTAMERTLGGLVLMWFISPFGTLAVASHSINQRVEMFLQVPAMGLGQAAGVLAGQNLGARQPGRAERTGWTGVGLLSALMAVCAAALLIWAEPIVHIFTSDPDLIPLAATFVRIGAAGYVLMGCNSVLQQCITGAGDTLIPMLVMLINMWAVQVPLALVLPKVGGLGVLGVRWAMVLGTATGVAAYIIYFRMGRWKKKLV